MRVLVTRKNRRSWWRIRIVSSETGKTVATTMPYFTKELALRAAHDIVFADRWYGPRVVETDA